MACVNAGQSIFSQLWTRRVAGGRGYTAYRSASLIDLYLHAKFHWNWRNFLWTGGWTNERTYVRVYVRTCVRTKDGHLRPTLLGRLWIVDLKTSHVTLTMPITVLFTTGNRYHVTQLLKDLHWLRVPEQAVHSDVQMSQRLSTAVSVWTTLASRWPWVEAEAAIVINFSTGCALHATIHDRRPRLYCRRAARMEQSAWLTAPTVIIGTIEETSENSFI